MVTRPVSMGSAAEVSQDYMDRLAKHQLEAKVSPYEKEYVSFWKRALAFLAIVSLIGAVAFTGAKFVLSKKLPVTILASAEDVHNFRVSPSEVAVTVQGNPRTLQNLQINDIRAIVDLTGVGAARDLRKRIEVSVPAGISQVRVTPEEVRVIFPPDR